MARAFPDTLLDFQRMFPDEAACVAYLEELRWPEGFVCSSCEAAGEPQRTPTGSGMVYEPDNHGFFHGYPVDTPTPYI